MAMKENPTPAPEDRYDDDEDSGTRIKTRLAIAAGLAVVALAAIPLLDSLGGKKAAPAPVAEPASGKIAAIAPEPATTVASAPVPDTASAPSGAPQGPDLASTPGMQVTPAVKLPSGPVSTQSTVTNTPAPAAHPVQQHATPASPAPRSNPAPAVAIPQAARTSTPTVSRPQADTAAQPAAVREPVMPAPAPAAEAPKARPSGSSLGYNVQLGLFSNMGNAQKMVEELRSKGIEVHTETRLHLGPFRSRAEAEESQAKLRSLGYAPLLIPAGN